MVEKLTDDVVKRLVGHTNVVYYNCETNAWNTSKYNGHTIDKQDADTKRVKEFKSIMEKIPLFSMLYEFAASVTMTIDIDSVLYPVWCVQIGKPKYSRNGTTVVGNIIVRDKKTGEYELYGKSWVGVLNFCTPDVAVFEGANRFARIGACYPVFREALRKAHWR
ncbi:MAG: hypothetical protein K2M34_03745 [Alphaproteobacteria bacterium]|nr:hypothetical protein [Alphaproteobacteria bacterium]